MVPNRANELKIQWDAYIQTEKLEETDENLSLRMLGRAMFLPNLDSVPVRTRLGNLSDSSDMGVWD